MEDVLAEASRNSTHFAGAAHPPDTLNNTAVNDLAWTDFSANDPNFWEGAIHLGPLRIHPWILGLLCAMTGYSLCGLGMNLIRLSHIVSSTHVMGPGAPNLKETRFNRKGSTRRSNVLWLLGYLVHFLGGGFNVTGLRFAAQSLLAPLSSMALIANALFATCILGERLYGEKDVIPMLLILLGNAVTVLSANHTGFKDLTVQQTEALFYRTPFVVYVVSVLITVIVLNALRLNYQAQIRKSGGPDYAGSVTVARMGLCHAGAACMLCVNTVFLAKASLLILASGAGNFMNPKFLFMVSIWASLGIFWIYNLNRLLSEYDALFIVPVIEVVWSLQSMIGGGIFFDEYSSLSAARLCCFFLGTCINITGVWILSKRSDRRASHHSPPLKQ